MNQGLTYEISNVMPQALNTGLFTSLCTITTQNNTLDSDGAPVYVPGTPLTGCVNIPCMDAVPSITRVQATEVRALQEIMDKSVRHMLLNGYYPQLMLENRVGDLWATVDGVIYDILGVEHDSQNTQTRIEMQLVQL